MRRAYTLQSRSKRLELGPKTRLMAVVNVTPDSFYDGGRHADPQAAVGHALRCAREGADILDIGGQSTRPASQPVGVEEELRRVLPVVQALRPQTDAWISIDTYRAEVARACLDAGADMINDVSSFRVDPSMPGVAATYGVPVCCMHYLQSLHPMPANPQYSDLFGEILQFFRDTFRIAEGAGIRQDRLILDPGIGFGKNLEHNLSIIRGLSFLAALDRPVLAGPSRKSFIAKLTGLAAEDRLEGTAAAAAVCVQQGAHILRIHDAQFFRRFCDVLDPLL
jgi:dihydropteroate synthase